MASSDGIYLTLPSDGSMATFPNTVAQFKTLLPQTIDLTDGELESRIDGINVCQFR